MNKIIHITNNLSAPWSRWMIHATWQGLLVLGLALFVLFLWRKASPTWRYGLLIIVLVKFLMPPFALPGLGLFQWIPSPRDSLFEGIASKSEAGKIAESSYEEPASRPETISPVASLLPMNS